MRAMGGGRGMEGGSVGDGVGAGVFRRRVRLEFLVGQVGQSKWAWGVVQDPEVIMDSS